jgi:hypothetical protein
MALMFRSSRYDNAKHDLTDYSSVEGNSIFPGQDYSNPRIKDFYKGIYIHLLDTP